MGDDFWPATGGTTTENRTPLRVVRASDPATREARRRLLQPQPRPRSKREPVVIGLVLLLAIGTMTLSYLGARNNSLFAAPSSTGVDLALAATTLVPAAPATLPTTQPPTSLPPTTLLSPTLPPATVQPTTLPPTTLPVAVAPPSLTDDFVNDFTGTANLPADSAPSAVEQSGQLATNLAAALENLAEDTPVLASGVVLDLDELALDEPLLDQPLLDQPLLDAAAEATTATALDANADFLNLVNEIFGVGGPKVVALENRATPASSIYAIEDIVRFEYKSRTIVKEHLGLLDKVVTLLERRPNVTIEVVGYTDSRGDADKNLALSQARADSVMAYLIYHGIDPDRLSAEGLGEASPVASNDDEEGRRLNRRIRLVLDRPTE